MSQAPARCLCLLCVAAIALAGAAASAEGIGAAPRYPLEREHRGLDRDLERLVRMRGWDALGERGDLAVAVVDLTGGGIRYAGINDDRMIYAASLPKIGILLGAFEALETGLVHDTPALRQQMIDMIRVSDNGAASAVLGRVGFETVARALTATRHQLYDAKLGGLWVGKAYGRSEYWRRDPVANLSHGATARQAARFFVLLQKGLLVSPQASASMKAILGDPGIEHKFVRGLRQRPGATVYRKSGTWHEYHADAALIERDEVTYVAVALVRDARGSAILERLIVGIDDIVRGVAAAPLD